MRRANKLRLETANVSELTVDAVRARIRIGRGLRIESKADKPYTLVLVSGKTTRRISIPAGDQTLTLQR